MDDSHSKAKPLDGSHSMAKTLGRLAFNGKTIGWLAFNGKTIGRLAFNGKTILNMYHQTTLTSFKSSLGSHFFRLPTDCVCVCVCVHVSLFGLFFVMGYVLRSGERAHKRVTLLSSLTRPKSSSLVSRARFINSGFIAER